MERINDGRQGGTRTSATDLPTSLARPWRGSALTAVLVATMALGSVDALAAAPTTVAEELARAGVPTDSALTTTSDVDSAVTAAGDGIEVDVARNPAKGATMRSPAGVIRIRIPGAVGAKDARGLGADAATFDTPANDTAEPVVQIANVRAAPDGAPSLQMLTRIPSLDAPSSYRFELDLPPGARMVPAADGGIVVLKGSEKNGEAVATIAAPWARDANGASVPVRYEIADRTSIVMHVDLTAPGLVAPVIADPWVQWSWHGVTVHFSRSETAWIGSVGQYGCPYFGGWPAVACTVVVATMSWAFRTAASHGYCLSVWKPYWSYWTATPWFRHC